MCPDFPPPKAALVTVASGGIGALDSIHLSNVLTDHFSNSLPKKTTKDIPMKFSQCPFKNIFYRSWDLFTNHSCETKDYFSVLRHVHCVC